MDNKSSISRRVFLGKTAKIAAGIGVGTLAMPTSRALGANERVQVGFIGPGGRGNHLMGIINQHTDAEVVAVADIFEGWKDRGVARAKEKAKEVIGYDCHLKMLEDDRVDAVVIATPEHAHCRHILDSLEAGKDVFCEKPMTHTWKEGIKIVRANEKAKKIIQIGTQRRSVDVYYRARAIVQSGGIGRITGVRGWWHRNSKDDQPQWRYGIPENASEANINWAEFLKDAPKAPFDLHRYFQWRCYWDYSNGPAGDLMVHQLDAINIVMGTTMPKSALGLGDIYRFHEFDRSTPDTWNAIIEHPGGNPWAPDGFMVNYSCIFSNERHGYGEVFLGIDGTIEMNDRELKVIPEREEVAMKKVEPLEVKSETWGDKEHLINFFECLKTRKQANCDEVQGHYAASAAHMAVLSHFEGKRVFWDEKAEKVA